MKQIHFFGITKEYGCGVYTSMLIDEDYTMNQLVNRMKDEGYKGFMLETMKRIFYIGE